jgi:agmatinase
MNKNISTILGCNSDYQSSSVVVFGAPYDSTTSFRPGTRFASQFIRNESWGLETYSPYQNRDLTDYNVFDAGDLVLPFGNTVKALSLIESFTKEILNDKKIPLMIGGEHLVTYGAVKAVSDKYEDLHIVHFDAHADLRDTFMDEKLSHATVLRRCWELTGDNRIFQFGIRSGGKSEFLWGEEHVYTNKYNFSTLEEILNKIKNYPVYLTIDLDVLDPSVFPGTGTPEPGGVSFHELLNAVLLMKNINIVGCDINELSPHYDSSGVSTAVAAKILRELLLAIQ